MTPINPKARWPFAEHAAEPVEPCDELFPRPAPPAERNLFVMRDCAKVPLLAADESLLRVAQLPDGRGRRG